jgi:polyprenyl-phospho-N-acetylgalactosaminyl synthase
MTNQKKILAILPAFNEQETIGGVIDDLLHYGVTPVVVNDGSTDRTEEIARSKNVRVLSHIINRGQGAALATGFTYAKKVYPDCVVTFDTDGQVKAKDIESLCEPILRERVDVVLGSRFLQKNNIPIIKHLFLKLALLYTRRVTGLKISDTHNGLRAFSMKALFTIQLRQSSMAHASEILNEIAKHDLKYTEVPVTILYSEYSMAKGQRLTNSINILVDLWFK